MSWCISKELQWWFSKHTLPQQSHLQRLHRIARNVGLKTRRVRARALAISSPRTYSSRTGRPAEHRLEQPLPIPSSLASPPVVMRRLMNLEDSYGDLEFTGGPSSVMTSDRNCGSMALYISSNNNPAESPALNTGPAHEGYLNLRENSFPRNTFWSRRRTSDKWDI